LILLCNGLGQVIISDSTLGGLAASIIQMGRSGRNRLLCQVQQRIDDLLV
jgi:hypothetical protein